MLDASGKSDHCTGGVGGGSPVKHLEPVCLNLKSLLTSGAAAGAGRIVPDFHLFRELASVNRSWEASKTTGSCKSRKACSPFHSNHACVHGVFSFYNLDTRSGREQSLNFINRRLNFLCGTYELV